jgi:hypothetical protein
MNDDERFSKLSTQTHPALPRETPIFFSPMDQRVNALLLRHTAEASERWVGRADQVKLILSA